MYDVTHIKLLECFNNAVLRVYFRALFVEQLKVVHKCFYDGSLTCLMRKSFVLG